MKLLEHEAKALLAKASVPIPYGVVITSLAQFTPITLPAVFKSQVPVGGRAKAGGVQIIEEEKAIAPTLRQLFNLKIKGFTPNVILVEEKLSIKNEHYLSLLVDRDTGSIRLLAYKNGGVEVESNKTKELFTAQISTKTVIDDAKKLAGYLDYDVRQIAPLLTNLLDTFIVNDTTLLEVNPFVFTTENEFICGDCKMELDDAAAFRHPDWEFEDKPAESNFVTLDKNGTVATIANGAGLAMATVDAVAAHGMIPANFLDIGGGANTESILRAFMRIGEFPRVEAIVINIFAGITRCDEVAKAVIAAKRQIPGLPPLFIRLAGTNFEEAVSLLANENITTLATLEECLKAAERIHHA